MDGDGGRSREDVEDRRTLLRLRNERLNVLGGCIGVDVEIHVDGIEAIADIWGLSLSATIRRLIREKQLRRAIAAEAGEAHISQG